MIHNLAGRKTCFITTSGEFATARGPTAEGDEIHLVEGCDFPLILRCAQKIDNPTNLLASGSSCEAPYSSGKQIITTIF